MNVKQFGQFCSGYPKLPCMYVGLHCNAMKKVNPPPPKKKLSCDVRKHRYPSVRCHWHFREAGGIKTKFFRTSLYLLFKVKSLKLNWNFQRGGVQTKSPSVRGEWYGSFLELVMRQYTWIYFLILQKKTLLDLTSVLLL